VEATSTNQLGGNKLCSCNRDFKKKKREIKGVGDFRPVSVLNASINILSKVLANHLHKKKIEHYH